MRTHAWQKSESKIFSQISEDKIDYLVLRRCRFPRVWCVATRTPEFQPQLTRRWKCQTWRKRLWTAPRVSKCCAQFLFFSLQSFQKTFPPRGLQRQCEDVKSHSNKAAKYAGAFVWGFLFAPSIVAILSHSWPAQATETKVTQDGNLFRRDARRHHDHNASPNFSASSPRRDANSQEQC